VCASFVMEKRPQDGRGPFERNTVRKSGGRATSLVTEPWPRRGGVILGGTCVGDMFPTLISLIMGNEGI